MKLLVCPKDKTIDLEINLGVTSFLLGVEGFTTNQDCCYKISEIKALKDKYPDIEIFLLLNKNIFNNEIDSVKDLLKEIEKLNISGIFFYDQAILMIHQKHGLKTPLVWNQTHMVTNYNTCCYYYEQGVEYGLLSGEITLEEMIQIKEHTKMRLCVTVLGYPVMSHSNRRLLTNYFSFIKREKDKNVYKLQETGKDSTYLVSEDNTGTTFYDGLLLNGTSALLSLIEEDFCYGVIFEKEMDDEVLEGIIPFYVSLLKKNKFSEEEKKDIVDKSNKILNSSNTGFFFKKTIYKVKRNG